MAEHALPGGLSGEERLARAALTYLAEPGDHLLGTMLEACQAAEVVAAIEAGRVTGGLAGVLRAGSLPARELARAVGRWRVRLRELPDRGSLTAMVSGEVRLICPGDPGWPDRIDQLGSGRPYALWVKGDGEPSELCDRAVSVVGSRAATGYGEHVALELAAELAERGASVVSGGAYGIDAAAHRGAIAGRGRTVAILAGGVDRPYPAGNAGLFEEIERNGVIVSEWPPGTRPTRLRFLVRNRVIAAITAGTVVVEASERSGALNTARHAAELNRQLMAVPGPVTSGQSAGCHRILRDWGGSCVTCAADVLVLLDPIGTWLAPGRAGAEDPAARQPDGAGQRDSTGEHDADARPWDGLDPDAARVLDAFPVQAVTGPATLAVKAGLTVSEVFAALGVLAGRGLVDRHQAGWRLSRLARP